MLIGCICKPYEVVCDGKPLLVENERMVGVIHENDEVYFQGVIFDEEDRGGDSVNLSKKDFNERVESWCEILVNTEKFDSSFYVTWKNGGLLNQKEIDGFSSLGKTEDEKIFRAGFLCGLHERKSRVL